MKKIFLTVMILVLAACGENTSATASNSANGNDAVYKRVMASSTIRCGYSVWPPLFTVDANTGAKGGVFGDVMEEIGRRYSLKIEWAEELGWASAATAVDNKRVDMACAGYWANTPRARIATFTAPIMYSDSYVWMRSDATNKPASLDDLNSPAYTFGSIDGSAEGRAITTIFPNAKAYTLPDIAPSSDLFEAVRTGKADAMVLDKATVTDYLNKYPNVFTMMFADKPLVMFPNVMMIAQDEPRLKMMIDNAIREIQMDGTLDRIIKKNNAVGLYKPVTY